jgi:hypothetical protein
VPKLVWRIKLVAELQPGVVTETEGVEGNGKNLGQAICLSGADRPA